MPRVVGLGHIGLYVRDLERMTAFYRDVLGMQVTKRDPARGMVFLSADPKRVDHEIALMRGRPADDAPRLLDQVSLRVETLDDVRAFHRRLAGQGYTIQRVSNHGSAIGCYFFDPEGNRTEIFWETGRECWVPIQEPIDLSLPDEAILAEVERVVASVRHVPLGGLREPAVTPAS